MENILKEHTLYMNKTLGLSNMVHNITTESVGSFVSGITEFFSNKLNVLCDLFKSNMQDRLKFKSEDKLNAFVVELQKELKKTSVFSTLTYSEIKSMKVPTVVGLNVSYPDAAKIMLPLLDIIKNKSFEYLDKLDVTTSKLISSVDYRMKTGPELEPFEIKKSTDTLDAGLKKAFSARRMADMDNFGNLFPSNNAVKSTADMLINAGSGITLDNIKEIDERVASIVEKIDVLVDQTKNKDYEISKEVMKSYSNLIEYCSNYVTSCVSTIQAYNQLVSILKTIITITYDKFK